MAASDTSDSFRQALQQLNNFSSISLEEMDSVRLMNRVDRKYAMHKSQLSALLQRLTPHYRILEIDKQRFFQYHTTYFDTPELLLYQAHHNGWSNRIKIRCRQYVDSGKCFFEIKQKQMGNRTHKLRYAIDEPFVALDKEALQAIQQQYTRCPLPHLDISLYNSFSRITLVNQALGERCTIDLDLKFESPEGRQTTAKDIAVVELKQARLNPLSPMIQALRSERIFPCSFSKYIYGLIGTRPAMKHNAFKPLLHHLARILRDHRAPTIQTPTSPPPSVHPVISEL